MAQESRRDRRLRRRAERRARRDARRTARRTGGDTTTVIMAEPSARGGFRARAREYTRARFGEATEYSKVVGNFGVQVGMEAAEISAGLIKTALDVVAENSPTTVDDMAFPWLQHGIGSITRLVCGRWVSRRSPSLAAVGMAFGSAMNGAVNAGFFQRHGLKAVKRAAERLQQSNP